MSSSDGFSDFGIGVEDSSLKGKITPFKVENGTKYLVSFPWISMRKGNEWDDEAAWGADGLPVLVNDEDGDLIVEKSATIRFKGCERIYIKGVGNVLAKSPAYAQFGQPKQAVATILIVWPTNRDGELDKASYNSGKGYKVLPFIFAADKYEQIRSIHRKKPLVISDLEIACPENGAEFQKMTFVPDSKNRFNIYLNSTKNPELRVVGENIKAEVKALAAKLNSFLARDMTLDEIREKLGMKVATSSSSSAAAGNVDGLLDELEDL